MAYERSISCGFETHGWFVLWGLPPWVELRVSLMPIIGEVGWRGCGCQGVAQKIGSVSIFERGG